MRGVYVYTIKIVYDKKILSDDWPFWSEDGNLFSRHFFTDTQKFKKK